MDHLEKFLRHIDGKLRAKLLKAIYAIEAGQLAHLDIKRLKGANHLYRCRVGNVRIIFVKRPDGTYFPLDAHFRGSVYNH